MLKSRPLLAAALLAAAVGGTAVAAAPVVLAQTAPAADQPAARPAPHHQAERPKPGQFIEGRIAFLRTELKVTPAQQPLFDRLADTMRTGAKDMAARREAMHGDQSPQTTLDRLEHRNQMIKAAAAESDQYLAAFRPFYESLSADQKKTADLLFARFGGGMGGHGGMRKH